MNEQLIEDPVFGYRARLSQEGDLLRGEFWVQRGGGGAVDHVHPQMEERFQLLDGELTFWLARRKREAGPGERLTVPPGTRHAFKNTGQGVAHLIVEIEPALNMKDLFEELAALARAGKWTRLGRRGIPTGPRALLEMAAFMDRYRDIIVLASPPPVLQRIFVPPLARLERWRRARAGRGGTAGATERR
jgi:quercetin dioxygenase-like cupin family protein